jgi:ABC-2 type transport system permease protein
LLVSAFVGPAPVISLLALSGLVVAGVRESLAGAGIVGVLVAVPAMVSQLAVFVLLSRVAVAVLGLALRSRLGAVGAGLINGAILAFLGQGWVFAVALGQDAGRSPSLVRYLPSGWGLLAVRGDYWALAAMVVLVVLLLGAWAASRGCAGRRPSP